MYIDKKVLCNSYNALIIEILYSVNKHFWNRLKYLMVHSSPAYSLAVDISVDVLPTFQQLLIILYELFAKGISSQAFSVKL